MKQLWEKKLDNSSEDVDALHTQLQIIDYTDLSEKLLANAQLVKSKQLVEKKLLNLLDNNVIIGK